MKLYVLVEDEQLKTEKALKEHILDNWGGFAEKKEAMEELDDWGENSYVVELEVTSVEQMEKQPPKLVKVKLK